MLNKKNILILGATGSIGSQVLDDLKKINKYNIIGIGFKTKINFNKNLKNVFFYSCDLKKIKNTQLLIKKILMKFKKIDIFINCAGAISRKGFEIEDLKNFQNFFNLNFLSSMIIIKKVIGTMKKRKKGHIIQLSSQVSKIPHIKGSLSYEISKACQNILSRHLAHHYGKYNIYSNALLVGTIKSKMQRTLSMSDINKIKSGIPLKRFGNPADISRLIKFLISDKNNYINGSLINISGGSILD